MNARERFLATMNYGSPDRPFLYEWGAYGDTVARWRREGLPDADYRLYIGHDWRHTLEANPYHCPPFAREIIKVEGGWAWLRDEEGNTLRTNARNAESQEVMPQMPEWIGFGLTKETWPEYRKLLDPETPGRFPVGWEDIAPILAHRDFPLGMHLGSVFGKMRNWMGLENICKLLYDDPAFVEEVADTVSWCVAETAKKQAEKCSFDYAVIWEDMAYKTASLIDPKMYRRLFGRYYERIMEVPRKAGISIVGVDCDGHVEELVPVWLDWGINWVFPWEAAAGNDMEAAREEYGRRLRMMGGMDKRVLAFGTREDIRGMVEAKRWLIEDGGYVPCVDHGVTPDIGWENFVYYRRLLYEVACG